MSRQNNLSTDVLEACERAARITRILIRLGYKISSEVGGHLYEEDENSEPLYAPRLRLKWIDSPNGKRWLAIKAILKSCGDIAIEDFSVRSQSGVKHYDVTTWIL